MKEQEDSIVFLRKIVKGGADRSYGIQVAALAGVPKPVLDRAKELVEELVDTDIASRAREIASYAGDTSRFVPPEVQRHIERKVVLTRLEGKGRVP